MSNEVTSEIPLKVTVNVTADEPVQIPAEEAPEPAAPEPAPEPSPDPEPEQIPAMYTPPPRRSWLSPINIITALAIAGLIVLGYYMLQGEGEFIAIDRNAEPFIDNGDLRQPQDISQSTVILEERFTQPRGSWTFSPPNQGVFYGEGLFLEDNIYTGEAWATPGLTFDDFVLKADSRWLGGALGGDYGIRIRKNNATGEYLALYLHNDGRFTVSHQSRRSLAVLANKYSSAIETDGNINKIQIEAVKNQVHFFVNGTYLGTFEDEMPASGSIEFVAVKSDSTDLFMAGFDNLIITHNFVEEQPADG